MKQTALVSLALVAGLCVACSWAGPQKQISKLPPVTTKQVARNIWYLHAAGGNVTALIGKDGTLLVDAEFAPDVPAILKKIKVLGGAAPKFVINTHYHRDHTGGNAAMRAAGATIIAQANVRARLEQVQRAPSKGSLPAPVPASKLPALPSNTH
ncbi:MAG: MBL fold metallo-hydrolase [Gammaproteobacteria bacterium]